MRAKVTARLERAELFAQARPPEFWAILHESILREPLLPAQEMADQLGLVLRRVREGVLVPQVIPWNPATRPFMQVTLSLMEYTDAPPLAYTEGPYHGHALDDPAPVRQYRKVYERLRATALSPDESLSRIAAAAEAYKEGLRPDQHQARLRAVRGAGDRP